MIRPIAIEWARFRSLGEDSPFILKMDELYQIGDRPADNQLAVGFVRRWWDRSGRWELSQGNYSIGLGGPEITWREKTMWLEYSDRKISSRVLNRVEGTFDRQVFTW